MVLPILNFESRFCELSCCFFIWLKKNHSDWWKIKIQICWIHVVNRLYTNYSIAENRKEKYNHPLHNLEFKKTMGRTKNSVCLAVLKYFLQLSCLEHLYLYSPGSSIICLLTKGPFIYYVSIFFLSTTTFSRFFFFFMY